MRNSRREVKEEAQGEGVGGSKRKRGAQGEASEGGKGGGAQGEEASEEVKKRGAQGERRLRRQHRTKLPTRQAPFQELDELTPSSQPPCPTGSMVPLPSKEPAVAVESPPGSSRVSLRPSRQPQKPGSDQHTRRALGSWGSARSRILRGESARGHRSSKHLKRCCS